MLKFIGGIMFAVGSYGFGKGMYELGRIKQKSESRKKLYKVCGEMNYDFDTINRKMKDEA